ncbi:hypothetical protein ABT270_15310 [Streptomyces sp900105245]
MATVYGTTGTCGRIATGRPRMGPVKAGSGAVREPSTATGSGRGGGFLEPSDPRTSLQELAMADLAFVVTVLAAFALVALVARGVTKL